MWNCSACSRSVEVVDPFWPIGRKTQLPSDSKRGCSAVPPGPHQFQKNDVNGGVKAPGVLAFNTLRKAVLVATALWAVF
jgi:hypothetical protein